MTSGGGYTGPSLLSHPNPVPSSFEVSGAGEANSPGPFNAMSGEMGAGFNTMTGSWGYQTVDPRQVHYTPTLGSGRMPRQALVDQTQLHNRPPYSETPGDLSKIGQGHSSFEMNSAFQVFDNPGSRGVGMPQPAPTLNRKPIMPIAFCFAQSDFLAESARGRQGGGRAIFTGVPQNAPENNLAMAGQAQTNSRFLNSRGQWQGHQGIAQDDEIRNFQGEFATFVQQVGLAEIQEQRTHGARDRSNQLPGGQVGEVGTPASQEDVEQKSNRSSSDDLSSAKSLSDPDEDAEETSSDEDSSDQTSSDSEPPAEVGGSSARRELTYSRYKEVKQYFKTSPLFMCLSPDPTIPKTNSQIRAFVRRGLDAVYDMSGDPITTPRWDEDAEFYNANQIERMIWRLVHKLIKLHTKGWIFPVGDKEVLGDVIKTKDFSFEHRFHLIEQYLQVGSPHFNLSSCDINVHIANEVPRPRSDQGQHVLRGDWQAPSLDE